MLPFCRYYSLYKPCGLKNREARKGIKRALRAHKAKIRLQAKNKEIINAGRLASALAEIPNQKLYIA